MSDSGSNENAGVEKAIASQLLTRNPLSDDEDVLDSDNFQQLASSLTPSDINTLSHAIATSDLHLPIDPPPQPPLSHAITTSDLHIPLDPPQQLVLQIRQHLGKSQVMQLNELHARVHVLFARLRIHSMASFKHVK